MDGDCNWTRTQNHLVLKGTLNHLASLVFSVRLTTKWFWVQVQFTSPSDFVPVSSKEFLDIQATIECGFTLKCVHDMTRTCSHIDG